MTLTRTPPAVSVTATLGVYGSASTWVFNVLRELTIAHYGAETVHAFFSDSVQNTLRDSKSRDRHLVWKLHQGDDAWPCFAALARARTVLTVRDPRDAAVSMMERFSETAELASAAVHNALRRVAIATQTPHLGLRYEGGFFRKPETVAALARFLGLPIAQAEQSRIFDTYQTERVKAFGAAFDTLPAERIIPIGDRTRYDAVTHIHDRHIGDGRIGKWRDVLTPQQKDLFNTRFERFLPLFGYEA